MNDTMEGYVNKNVVMVETSTPVVEVYQLMKKNNIRHIPVVDNGQAVGIISDRDVNFITHGGESLNLTSKDIMTNEPYSVDSQTTIPHVVQVMSQKKINSVLIHGSDKKIVGIFTSTDALKVLSESFKSSNA